MEGRNCLIVGGTSGIGLASARRFLEEGAKVVIAGLDPAVAEPRTAPGPLATGVVDALASLGPCGGWSLDASDPRALGVLFEEATAFFGGRLDVLFQVAGISGRKSGDGPLHECTDSGWDRVMEVNARGTFLANREAARVMLRQEPDDAGLRGTVLNVGSVLSPSPSPDLFGTYAYTASKGAIEAMTRTAAARYARDRIRFNLLVPGLIDTPMATRAVQDPRIREYLKAKQPLSGGPGTAEDCAEAALFLCEPASRFVTGAVLTVDGGWCVSEGGGTP
ncbi:MAG: SDR family oxidoreductase [Isosphaeraceae bacterium]|nr:SDR family oxidoreductase [Isosphaeraceae bacterium]